MTFDKALRIKGVAVSEGAAHACRYLEANGFQYGKDFTAGTAIIVAGEHIIELEHEYDEAETQHADEV